MRKIRSLSTSKLKTVNKEVVKVRVPKHHLRVGNRSEDYFTSYSYNRYSQQQREIRVWCGLNLIPREDSISDESVFLSQLRNPSQTRVMGGVNCSCCLNMVQRSVRQRMLGIQ